MSRLLAAVVACALVTAAPAHARPGQLDRSFSGDGRAELTPYVGPIAGDPDGGVTLVNGPSTSGAPSAVHRLTPAGMLDRRFGQRPVPSTLTSVSTVAVDGKGRVVLSGSFSPDAASSYSAVIRLTADGRPDPGFAGGLGLRAPANSRVTSPLVAARGDMGWGYGADNGFRLMRIGSDGRVVSTDEMRIGCDASYWSGMLAGDLGGGPGRLFGSPGHLRSMFWCLSDPINGNKDRTVIARPDAATPVVVPGVVTLATASGAGYIVLRHRQVTPPGTNLQQLERLTPTGTVSWTLNLEHRIGDISSLVSDDHGGAYVTGLVPPTPGEAGKSCLDGAVLHVTSRGTIDRTFGRRGLVRLPVHVGGPKRGGVAPELATTRTRLYVKYGDTWCEGTNDRDGPFTLRQAIAALTRR